MSKVLSRRGFLKRSLGAAAAMASATSCATGASAPTRKPNIVFILIDDLGWADLGCYGHTYHESPNIDRLATQGMRFTDAYAACPVCSPTRASIISGQYPARCGITDFIPGHLRPWAKLRMPVNRFQYLPLEHVTVAEALKDAGYTTAAIGKWHLGGRDYFPDHQGFDTMLVTNGRHTKFRTVPPIEVSDDDYLSETLTDHAEKFMEENRDRPFFLYLAHYAVHIPLDAREELIKKYEAKPKPDGRITNPIYAGMVEHVDDSVGRIMAKLAELGLEKDTLLVFFSDNGGLQLRFDGQGPFVTENTPLRDEKGSPYEGGIREPLIVRWPGHIKPGSECDVPVTSVDFYPTFLDVAGTQRPPTQVLDGESILPLLERRGGLKRDAIYWHYPNYHHSTPSSTIREGDWKLIEFFEDGSLELYNLKDDIGEAHNLASAMPDKAAALQKRLAAWRTSVNAAMPEPNPDYDPLRAHEWGKRTPPKPPQKK